MMRLRAKDLDRCVGCQLCMYACSRRQGKIGTEHSGILAVSLSGFERGATVIFCRACERPPCAEVCPTGALVPRKGGGVRYAESRCMGCGNCVDACTLGAIFRRRDGKVSVCVHCGYCVSFCAHGVLEYSEAEA